MACLVASADSAAGFRVESPADFPASSFQVRHPGWAACRASPPADYLAVPLRWDPVPVQ